MFSFFSSTPPETIGKMEDENPLFQYIESYSEITKLYKAPPRGTTENVILCIYKSVKECIVQNRLIPFLQFIESAEGKFPTFTFEVTTDAEIHFENQCYLETLKWIDDDYDMQKNIKDVKIIRGFWRDSGKIWAFMDISSFLDARIRGRWVLSEEVKTRLPPCAIHMISLEVMGASARATTLPLPRKLYLLNYYNAETDTFGVDADHPHSDRISHPLYGSFFYFTEKPIQPDITTAFAVFVPASIKKIQSFSFFGSSDNRPDFSVPALSFVNTKGIEVICIKSKLSFYPIL